MAGYKHLEIPGNFERYVKDKKQSANSYFKYFLARLGRMFEYENLPDTIPHEILDRYLFINGIALITEVEGKLYTFYGNLGGPQDVYYRPTEFIVSNPHIKTKSGELFTANVPVFNTGFPVGSTPLGSGEAGASISADGSGALKGVLIRNDTEWQGLTPMLSRYSYLMAENILTLRTADVMLRITSLLTAPSDKERASALEYLKTIENGGLGVIGESPFFDGVKLQSPPSNNGSYLTQFIEYQQYLKGSIYNELGLSANYNMKREAIGKGESTLDEDALLPLADNMLLCRRQDLEKVNQMYGTSITVKFSSSWLENTIETLKALSSNQNNQPNLFGAAGSTPAFGGGDGNMTGADGENENGEQRDVGEVGANGAAGGDGADGDSGRAVEDATEREDENCDEGRESEDGSGDDAGYGDVGSDINDLSQDECLDEILDGVIEGLTPEVGMDVTEDGDKEGGEADEEETEADEGSDSID